MKTPAWKNPWRDATARGADSSPDVSAESALRALGMIAEPSAFRQSRFERQREAAAAKKAAKAQSSTQPNWSSTSTTAPRLAVSTDPFADYLRDEGIRTGDVRAQAHERRIDIFGVSSVVVARRDLTNVSRTRRHSQGGAAAEHLRTRAHARRRRASTSSATIRQGTSSSDDDD